MVGPIRWSAAGRTARRRPRTRAAGHISVYSRLADRNPTRRFPHCVEASAGGHVEDRIAVDAVGGDRDVAGLAKAVEAERDDGIARYCAKPR